REEPEDDTEASQPAGSAESILLVEDNPDLRVYLADMLRGLGYRVLTAGDADAALAILGRAEQVVDLMLTDIVMPRIDGRELARRVQPLRPGIPVLYMTGYSRNAVVHQGRLDEGIDFLQKPISQAELATRLRDMLDRRAGSASST